MKKLKLNCQLTMLDTKSSTHIDTAASPKGFYLVIGNIVVLHSMRATHSIQHDMHRRTNLYTLGMDMNESANLDKSGKNQSIYNKWFPLAYSLALKSPIAWLPRTYRMALKTA